MQYLTSACLVVGVVWCVSSGCALDECRATLVGRTTPGAKPEKAVEARLCPEEPVLVLTNGAILNIRTGALKRLSAEMHGLGWVDGYVFVATNGGKKLMLNRQTLSAVADTSNTSSQRRNSVLKRPRRLNVVNGRVFDRSSGKLVCEGLGRSSLTLSPMESHVLIRRLDGNPDVLFDVDAGTSTTMPRGVRLWPGGVIDTDWFWMGDEALLSCGGVYERAPPAGGDPYIRWDRLVLYDVRASKLMAIVLPDGIDCRWLELLDATNDGHILVSIVDSNDKWELILLRIKMTEN